MQLVVLHRRRNHRPVAVRPGHPHPDAVRTRTPPTTGSGDARPRSSDPVFRRFGVFARRRERHTVRCVWAGVVSEWTGTERHGIDQIHRPRRRTGRCSRHRNGLDLRDRNRLGRRRVRRSWQIDSAGSSEGATSSSAGRRRLRANLPIPTKPATTPSRRAVEDRRADPQGGRVQPGRRR